MGCTEGHSWRSNKIKIVNKKGGLWHENYRWYKILQDWRGGKTY